MKTTIYSCAVNRIAIAAWFITATLSLHAQPETTNPLLQLLRPNSTATTVTQPHIHIAARTTTAPGTEASVGGTTVPIFGTGVFVRDYIPLEPGLNRVPVTVFRNNQQIAQQEIVVTRVSESPTTPTAPSSPLMIDADSITPSENLALAPGDDLQVSFRGASGNLAEFQMSGGRWVSMPEVLDPATSAPTGVYRGSIRVTEADVSDNPETSEPVTLRLRGAAAPEAREGRRRRGGERPDAPSLLAQTKSRVTVWPSGGPARLYRVKDDATGHIAYGLTEVRLGGPYLSEVCSGTVVRAIGRQGSNLKIELTPSLHAWIPAHEVVPAAPGTEIPHLEFADINVSTTLTGDEMLIISYPERIPYAVRDVPAAGPGAHPQLHIDFFGAHHASTWISHRSPGKIVSMVTMEQPATNHVRVIAHLAAKRIWGYRTEFTSTSMNVILRHAPELETSSSPLKGLTIAVEAGHGKESFGARGIAGGREGHITRAVADLLETELATAGARVVQTRIGDEDIGMPPRWERAMRADANLFVSIHCNSAGSPRGFLGTKGNAMFYKHPFNHELATMIHQRIVEQTGLAPYGTIGNFNYSPTRVLTWMPAVLVEQAFISNPEEEALMVDPAFQKKMAVGIRLGLEDWLRGEGSTAKAKVIPVTGRKRTQRSQRNNR